MLSLLLSSMDPLWLLNSISMVPLLFLDGFLTFPLQIQHSFMAYQQMWIVHFGRMVIFVPSVVSGKITLYLLATRPPP